MKKEDAERLISKLLEVTEDKGATADEAAVAADKASALMARFGIDRIKTKGKRVDVGEVIKGRITRAEFWLADAAASLTGCKALAVGLGRRAKGVCFVGDERSREAACALFVDLRIAVANLTVRASKEYRPMVEPGKMRIFIRDFRQGCSMRVVVRAKQRVEMDEFVRSAKAASARPKSDGSSLVVVPERVEDEVRKVTNENTDGRKVDERMSNPQSYDSYGTLLGWKCGTMVDLRGRSALIER